MKEIYIWVVTFDILDLIYTQKTILHPMVLVFVGGERDANFFILKLKLDVFKMRVLNLILGLVQISYNGLIAISQSKSITHP